MSDPLTDLASAVAGALGALLLDKDVSSVDVVEGGLPELVRRGRRERLQILVEGPLFGLLRERGADTALLEVDLPGGVHLAAGPLLDGRVALSVRRAAPTDVSLAHLVEEGLVPAGVPEELVAAVQLGLGLVVLGPAQSARTRLTVAVARAASKHLRIMALGPEVPAQTVPAPLVHVDTKGAAPDRASHLVARAHAACALGADALCAQSLTVAELAALLRASLPVPLLASVAVTNMALLREGLGPLSPLAVGLAAVVGFDPEGRPRLVELHGDSGSSSSTSAPSSAPSSTLPLVASSPTASPVVLPASSSAPSGVSSSSRRSSSAATVVIDDLPGLGDAPPAEWASEHIDDDPGWELGPVQSLPPLSSSASASTLPPSLPPVPGSFDAALQQAARRPAHGPRAPSLHPQASAMRGTGGLTFEPPGGGPVGGHDDGGDGGDDGEP